MVYLKCKFNWASYPLSHNPLPPATLKPLFSKGFPWLFSRDRVLPFAHSHLPGFKPPTPRGKLSRDVSAASPAPGIPAPLTPWPCSLSSWTHSKSFGGPHPHSMCFKGCWSFLTQSWQCGLGHESQASQRHPPDHSNCSRHGTFQGQVSSLLQLLC